MTNLLACYIRTRQLSEQLVTPLSEADVQIQSMADASPAKWHLAHTSWFFETFILRQYLAEHQEFNPHFNYLFNSYYNVVGGQYLRANRGLISRPGLAEIIDYRHHIDAHIHDLLLQQPTDEIHHLLELGIHHEQQHQELLLTDIKHGLFQNPIYPAYLEAGAADNHQSADEIAKLQWLPFNEGLYLIGHRGDGFAFDNEKPPHQVYLQGFSLASRLVTNREYIEFIEQGAYQDPLLWLADGWRYVQTQQLELPLYWLKRSGQYYHFTLAGLQKINLNQPVCHINYYEANAYASWAGTRLPTEFEWEVASAHGQGGGQFLDLTRLHPQVDTSDGLVQMSGTAWQWTSSQYGAYPGFRPFAGHAGEYNGKFMSNQFVLRGGSCVTSSEHYRVSYRNFFYPHQAWQFTGIRLAGDF